MANTARITRQYVEAGGAGDGLVRITREYVEVLAATPPLVVARQIVAILGNVPSIYLRSASSTLSMTQAASRTLVKFVDASHTLSMAQSETDDYVRIASSTLSLTQLGDYEQDVTPSIGDSTLSLTQSATVQFLASYPVSSTLSLTQTVGLGFSLTVAASNSLSMSQSADAEVLRFAEDTITLTHSVGLEVHSGREIAHSLAMTHEASAAKIVTVSASSLVSETHWNYDPDTGELIPYYIGLQDQVTLESVRERTEGLVSQLYPWHQNFVEHVRADGISADADHTLSLESDAFRNVTPDDGSTLSITDTATVDVSKGLSHTLSLTDEASATVVYNVSGVSTLSITQSIGWSKPDTNLECVYAPQIGDSPLATPPATLDGPVPGIGACRLVYPPTSPTQEAILRSPEFGNKQKLSCQRISRETRGGTLLTFADPTWPKIETLVWVVKGLTLAQKNAVVAFYLAHLGEEVGLVDYEQRFWRGVIVMFDPVVQDGRTQYTVGFEFEGELANWEP